MTEVAICGGGHHTRLNNQIVCLWGAPSTVYKEVEEGEGRPSHGVPKGGVLLPVGVGFPLSLVGVGEGRRREGEGKGAAPTPIWIGLGGRPHLGRLLLSPTKAH